MKPQQYPMTVGTSDTSDSSSSESPDSSLSNSSPTNTNSQQPPPPQQQPSTVIDLFTSSLPSDDALAGLSDSFQHIQHQKLPPPPVPLQPVQHRFIAQNNRTATIPPISHPSTTTDEDEEDEEEEDEQYPSSLAASSVPRTSLVEDFDERYGFSSSEESYGLLDDQLETSRMLKRRKKVNNNILLPCGSSNGDPPLNRSSYSDDSPSCPSRPPSPLPNQHLHPSPPLYWNQPIPPSSSRHHHHLYHPKHHHHHHHHHHHQPIPAVPTTLITPSANMAESHSNNSSTSCLKSVSTGFAGLASSAPYHHLQLSDDLLSTVPNSEFFHSHHLRTSAPFSSLRHNRSPHHSVPDLSRVGSSPRLSEQTPGAPPSAATRSKKNWFSSRRSKRKNSIHALSATSSSSTASLHSIPSSVDQLAAKHPDITVLKYSASPSRPSTTRWRRWMRSLNSCGLSFRWLKKLSGPRLPLGILLGLVVLISFAVSLTIFLIHYLDTDKEPLPWRTYCQEQREFPHELADSLDPVNVFVGVFSVDSAYERRHLIRSTYARHSRPIDPNTGQIAHNVQLKFVLGRPRIQHVRRIALEMETYNDIVVLDIQENMNRGKTYAFLNWASENATIPVYFHPLHEPKPKTGINGIGGVIKPDGMQTVNVGVGFKKADFIVKADDDSFIVLSELERHLRVAPRTMTYWGYLIRNLFMGGECYALSADLVNYVASSPKVLDHVTGAEDKKVAKWMRIHPNASQINWVTERCWIYDHPKAGTTYAHGFLFPDEVQRVRAEGRVGLTEAEIEARGPGRAQSYSTVIKWKERYVAPKSMMTMEEEVEALVEGGGRFTKTDWKRPTSPEDLVSLDKVLFESQDDRLLKSSIIGGPTSVKSSSLPRPGEYTPPIKNHYEEPSLKFGRPPSELMAKMPAMEDLPESPLKDRLRQALTTAEIQSEGSTDAQRVTDSSSRTSAGHVGERQTSQPVPKFIPSPTLRFDPKEMKLRDERFLHRPHGGTVVVHYLKRSEWFLETSLILLGRAKTWDDGLVPLVYEPTHQLRAAGVNSPASSLQPQGNSVVVSENSPASSDAFPTDVGKPSSSRSSEKPPEHQKKIEVGRLDGWGKFDQVEEIQAGGLFGGARMTGSPVIDKNGLIHEGRKLKLNHLPSSSSNDASPSVSSNPISEDNSSSSLSLLMKNMGDKDHSVVPGNPHSPLLESEEDDQAEQKNEIRKTQFGGAGWIRGKPRLRVADQADGPQLGAEASGRSAQSEAVDDGASSSAVPAPPPNDLDQDQPTEDAYLLQGLDSSLVLGKQPASTPASSVAHSESAPEPPLGDPLVGHEEIDQQIVLPPS
ncbi:hypothetical protein PCANC_00848 [Puccinia coronata f. sp. avenae]|uniref:Glycosyltransferase family 31 protein n=1 Tax=Puccinia coronata f. sp. avenae TaxID=200324 RepID=A0A2N5W7Q9_9BASI|nr:hypothetical protein PCANC_00848 [Puccinia coronata f. sp. avenae]